MDEGIVLHFILDPFSVQMEFDGIVSIEIKFRLKREVRGNFEVAGSTQYLVMNVNVILLDWFCAFVQILMFSSFFGGEFTRSHGLHMFGVSENAEDVVT